jgi:fatty-acyl-CoA synthase
MTVAMLDWLSEPSTQHGIRFARDDGGWDLWTYQRLAVAIWGAAEQLRSQGVRRSDVVGIVTPTGPAFVAAYFGALAAGVTPAPLAPPTLFDDERRYISHVASLMRSTAALIVTEPGLTSTVKKACAEADVARAPVILDLEHQASEAIRSAPAELALLQFTSGSSGTPRGVKVTYDNLEANIAMIRDWIDWGPDDAGAHWLPLYHDMGLIGCLLTPAIHQRDLWILRPDQFVREPERWLDCFGRGPAVFTAGPNFCFAYAAKRIDPSHLDGCDFSRWRAAIVGAERLDPGALGRFIHLLAPHGFRPETFLPAYGMAEATLAITGVERHRVPRVVKPDWSSIAFGQTAAIEMTAELGDEVVENGDGWLVGCGGPLPGAALQVLDEAGRPLAEGMVGELEVSGTIVTAGYLSGSTDSVTAFTDGKVRTGDAGFIHAGEVYVVGRLGDAIKVRGKTLYAEDLEAKLAAIRGVPAGRCVVVPGVSESDSALTVIVEAQAGEWLRTVIELLRREAGREVKVQVFGGDRGTILRTSSGKPRRRVIWHALERGELELELLHDGVAPSVASG